jgi:hypothetical protein
MRVAPILLLVRHSSKVSLDMKNAKMKIPGRICFAILLSLASVIPIWANGHDDASDQQLIAASERGDVAAVKMLLAQGASVGAKDERGRTALMAATHANQVETAAVLIAAGADVNARDNLQDTPYLYAGAEGRLEILRLTLAAGADLKSTNRFGGTALIPAAEKGHLENVRELLKTKIEVNHVNHYGWTALLEVCLKPRGPVYTEITRLLLAGGANPNLADKDGVTPLAHAEHNGNVEMAKLLKAAGGR